MAAQERVPGRRAAAVEGLPWRDGAVLRPAPAGKPQSISRLPLRVIKRLQPLLCPGSACRQLHGICIVQQMELDVTFTSTTAELQVHSFSWCSWVDCSWC